MKESIKALREKRAETLAKAEALPDFAKSENRELTADENTQIDAAIVSVGEIDKQIERLTKLDAITQAKLTERAESVSTGAVLGDVYSKIVLPAKAKRSGFKAFNGPDAAKDAYISGQFYAAALFGNTHAGQWLQDHGLGLVRSAMSGSDNSKGGYLVPEVLEGALIRLVEDYGLARRECRVVPMGSDNVSFPRRASGFTSYYLGQGSEITASDMTFDQIRLEAKKLAILCKISSELGEDAAYNVGEVLTQEFAYKMAYDEDAALFLGDGGATYGGIVGLKNALAAGAVQTGGGGLDSFSEVVIGELESAMSKLPQYPGLMPKWYCHSSFFYNVLQRLAFAAGGNTTENFANGMARSFAGYPVVFSQTLPSGTSSTDLSDQFVAYFGDLSMGVTFGARRGVTMASTSDRYFETDQIGVRVTERFDINVHERGTATAAGPVVAIKMGS